MKYRLQKFFYGRNGFDTIVNVILISSLVIMLIGGFIPIDWLGFLLHLLAFAGLIYGYFRIFSRNLPKRQRENYLFREFFRVKKLKWKERKTHRYFKCPRCKAWLRVPNGRGEITVTCRSCRHRFDKKT